MPVYEVAGDDTPGGHVTDLTILGEDEGVTRADAPRIPEPLLAPLLDVAGDLLRSLSAAEIPLPLRPLAGFDRRGLARSAARQQLLTAVENDSGFREQVAEQFLERTEVEAVLERLERRRGA